jgi:hypothetical protein
VTDRARERYAEQFPPEVVERQAELAKTLHPCCGEHRDGPHHEACRKYVEPEPTVHPGQATFL